MAASPPPRTDHDREARPVGSTAPDAAGIDGERRGRTIRRIVLGLFAGLVLLGLSGNLGVRSGTQAATTADGTTTARLTHARVARAALPVPFRLEVEHPDGFEHPVEVRVSREWMESFDENGMLPQPDSASADGPDVVWTFAAPPGETFTLAFDVRVDPGVQWRREGTTRVDTGDDRLTFTHTMWVLP